MDLGSLFGSKAAPLLGLDISSSSVKLVELGRDKNGNYLLERCAIEPLERGWINDGVIALLGDHHVGLTLSDARWIPRKQMLALATRPTADFLYVRWMGANRDIVDYSRIQIDRAMELEQWAGVLWPLTLKGVSVYGYVNNHFAGHSPESARELQRLLKQTPVDPETLGEQMSLF